MTFIDTASVIVIGGHGGAGAVTFRREIYVPKGGPDGGDGGDGGSVIFVASDRLQTLMDLHIKKMVVAQNGEPGRKKNQSGAAGNDFIITVPTGTAIFNEDRELIADLCVGGSKVCVAKGGKGGKGNATFKSATNQTPRYAQAGQEGEKRELHLELKLIAQVGLVGLPNAGKSTLLHALTHANPKIANYPFTTLHPNLGVLRYDDRELVVADIPGLVEGASQGKGLGNEFLRHISRTQLLVHLVSVLDKTPEQAWKDYQTIQTELTDSGVVDADFPILVVLSQIDTIDFDTLHVIQRFFEEKGTPVLAISSHTREGISELSQQILRLYNYQCQN